MKIVCPFCLNRSHIRSSNPLNAEATIVDLYCQCANVPTCGASFVYSVSFKHALVPPVRTHLQIAREIIARLSQEEKAVLQIWN